MTGLSLTMNEVLATQWPLLRYVADDPVYQALYKQEIRTFVTSTFTTSAMHALFEKYHTLIAPYVVGTDGEQARYTHLSSTAAFTSAVADLDTHVQNRRALVSSYVP